MQTGHVTFDKKAGLENFMTGNVVSSIQLSNYIRGKQTVECNGFTFKEGELRAFDLKHFKDLPMAIRNKAESLTEGHEPVVLYQIRHWNGDTKVVHGYVITRPIGNGLRHEVIWRSQPGSAKTEAVVAEACKQLGKH